MYFNFFILIFIFKCILIFNHAKSCLAQPLAQTREIQSRLCMYIWVLNIVPGSCSASLGTLCQCLDTLTGFFINFLSLNQISCISANGRPFVLLLCSSEVWLCFYSPNHIFSPFHNTEIELN